ncbi:putative cyclase-domain-containing protein [Aspergillus unguis]
MAMMEAEDLPQYKDIPPLAGLPHGYAWGLWDRNGERDQLGSLNMLTPTKVLAAKEEIQRGISVSLNWPLENIRDPGHNRNPIEHRFLDLKPHLVGHDDEITINTQTSSQWDGLRHWAFQGNGLYYNGLTHEEISGSNRNNRNGMQEWLKRGGVVGRGVLIDYASWAEKNDIHYSPASKHTITEKDLDEVARDQILEFRPGDILLLRTGWIKWYNEASPEERIEGCKVHHNYCGLEGTESSIEWLWNHRFAALVGDNMAFEAWPAEMPYRIHDTALGLWGTPIGELWDMEALARACKEQNRWSFFLTSAPLNIDGGVASPPNALAIF